MHELAAAPQLSCDSGLERRRKRVCERERPVAGQAAPRRLRLLRQRREHLRLGRGADSRRLAQPAGFGRCAQLVRRTDPERAAERHEPLRAEPEIAAERHELGLDLALQLLELGDPARLDQLAQAALDTRPDAAQLARPSGAHELCHGRRRRADQVGGPAIGADAPVRGAGEVEQSGVGVERAGDLGVVHGASVSPCRPW